MSTESNAAQPKGAPEAPLKGIRVLVVDDSKINLLVAEKLLLHGGASVSVEYDGSTALVWLQKNVHNVDLVLLDVQMPIMDGLTAVGLIRANPALRHLPVIAMTAADSDEERAHALACGMTDHVIKPFNFKTLVSVVLQHLGQPVDPASIVLSIQEPAGGVDWPVIAGIETQQAKNGYLGDRESFLKQLKRLLAEFEHFQTPPPLPAHAQAWRDLTLQMHKLVGNAGLLAAQSLALAARQAELLAKSSNPEGLTAAMQAVADQLLSLRREASVALEKHAQTPRGVSAPAVVDRSVIARWIQDLQAQKFSAVKRFAEIKSDLSTILAADQMTMLTDAMDCLEFDRALELVKPLSTTH